MRLVTQAKTWFDAKFYCESNGDYLATFDSLQSASWLRMQWLSGERGTRSTLYESIWLRYNHDQGDIKHLNKNYFIKVITMSKS